MTSAPIDLADRQTTLPAINNRVILREIQKRFSRLRIFVYLDKPQLSPKVAPETVGSSFNLFPLEIGKELVPPPRADRRRKGEHFGF
jgi:hypothetical protein